MVDPIPMSWTASAEDNTWVMGVDITDHEPNIHVMVTELAPGEPESRWRLSVPTDAVQELLGALSEAYMVKTGHYPFGLSAAPEDIARLRIEHGGEPLPDETIGNQE